MAKVKVYIQTIQEFETEIDNSKLRLDLDRSTTASLNNTIYKVSFTNGRVMLDELNRLTKDFRQVYGDNTEIVAIEHINTGYMLYEE